MFTAWDNVRTRYLAAVKTETMASEFVPRQQWEFPDVEAAYCSHAFLHPGGVEKWSVTLELLMEGRYCFLCNTFVWFIPSLETEMVTAG